MRPSLRWPPLHYLQLKAIIMILVPDLLASSQAGMHLYFVDLKVFISFPFLYLSPYLIVPFLPGVWKPRFQNQIQPTLDYIKCPEKKKKNRFSFFWLGPQTRHIGSCLLQLKLSPASVQKLEKFYDPGPQVTMDVTSFVDPDFRLPLLKGRFPMC